MGCNASCESALLSEEAEDALHARLTRTLPAPSGARPRCLGACAAADALMRLRREKRARLLAQRRALRCVLRRCALCFEPVSRARLRTADALPRARQHCSADPDSSNIRRRLDFEVPRLLRGGSGTLAAASLRPLPATGAAW